MNSSGFYLYTSCHCTFIAGIVGSGIPLPYRKPGMSSLGFNKNGLLKRKTDYAYVNGQPQMV
ncbi:MAG TPA: hypothetical protein VIN08_05215, partial [Ohtaekwangia sp.]|uniref:hypothetical protein n=1 Tax=Ohtaekwangia sp. TaxID=2066019 RepID=UPI002F94FD8D